MKEVILKFKFDDEGGYDGHGDDVGEIIRSILEREIKIELEGDGVVKKGWKLEIINNYTKDEVRSKKRICGI